MQSGRGRGAARARWLAVLAVLVLLAGPACRRGMAPTVVVYAAQDQVHAEPVLRRFEQETGVRVRAVYDSEAVKTVGLANRLLAERSHPQCDLFWGNEELRTRQLAALGVFRETNGWAAFGHRSRRLVIHTNRVAAAETPSGWQELTNTRWRGRVALAYPLFGSTSTHLLALRQRWGVAGWQAWCRALAENAPLILDGNSQVARLVARGEAHVGMTDSDDAAVVLAEGAPVRVLPMGGETLLLRNTVGLVLGGPHPEEAAQLYEFLRSESVREELVRCGALEGAGEGAGAAVLAPDWTALVRELEAGLAEMQRLFRR